MLDKIDKPEIYNSACVCSSPDNPDTCNFCLTNSYQKSKQVPKLFNYDTASHKKSVAFSNLGTNYFNLHNHFNDTTPNHSLPYLNTPGYGRYNQYANNSENKINYAK